MTAPVIAMKVSTESPVLTRALIAPFCALLELELELDAGNTLDPVPVANDVQFGRVEDDCLFSCRTLLKLRLRCRIAAGYSKLGSCSSRLINLALVEFSGKKAGVSGLHLSVRSGSIPVSK